MTTMKRLAGSSSLLAGHRPALGPALVLPAPLHSRHVSRCKHMMPKGDLAQPCGSAPMVCTNAASHVRCSAVASTSAPELSPSMQWSFANRQGLIDNKARLMLKNLTLQELEEWCISIGEPARRAMQLWRWMYADPPDYGWVRSPEDTATRQSGFSKAFCSKSSGIASMDGGLRLLEVVRAKDGTRKLVFELTQGEGKGGRVESVLIPVVRESGTKPRITLCVSSQVGCAMNCQFCYTGRLGLMANLSTAQIVEQLVEARRFLHQEGDTVPITNIVFMGMGEPLHNLDAVVAACNIMCHPLGLHMSQNKVTVSTVGLVEQMEAFLNRSQARLALSLHATTDEVRDWIAPVNRRHNIQELLALLRRHFQRGSKERPLLVEYVMLAGVNDMLEDAHRLAAMINDIECKVNLIVFNPHSGTRFKASPMEDVLAFRSVLIQAGRVCTIRDSRGDDEMAACGQLGGDVGPRSPPILKPPERFRGALVPAL